MKLFAAILVVVVGGLVWALYALRDTRHQLAAQQQSNELVIVDYSNRWESARRTLDEQKKVNEVLETNLTDRARDLETLRVDLAGLNTDVARLNTDLARSRTETKSALAEVAKRDSQIAALEGRNAELSKQIGELEGNITGLESEITAAEEKLAAADGDRTALLEDLRRLQGEKIAMEKQLNDLAFVRDQVRKLKEELTVARRLDQIRRGVYAGSRKGAEALASQSSVTPSSTTTGRTAQAASSPGLDVELRRTGEVNVTTRTNTVATPK
ncbi:MAG: hypothetical protein IT580_19330 [Verrucomicrobiales bacterium]|nr:hypothetical protein [Verrucomicrobiales bacterium]